MKTRRGRKRTSPKPLENEDHDSEGKKPKLNSKNCSKYFLQPSNSSHEEQKLEDISVHSNNDDDSVGLKELKQTFKPENGSDDESSSDEFMKVPFSLDDLGDFESLKKESTSSTKGNKICTGNETFRLSDYSGEEDMKIGEENYYDFSQIIQTQELLLNTKKELEEKKSCAKETPLSNKKNKIKSTKGKGVKFTNKPVNEELGISELLAITEGPMMVHKPDDQCSDEDEPDNEKYSVPEEGVQVTIQLPNIKQKKKSQGFDMEAAMKRRLNLIRKENQVFMHKVHTLCWIAHGIYLNRTINSDDLMGLALSLIPSKHCYPSKHADLNYLEKLVEWFIGKVIIEQDHQLALNNLKPPLIDVLEIEIKSKKAFSKRDLVLIFVCMVRSLGIDARLVISFRSVPIRPPASDLCSVSNTKSSKSPNNSKSKKVSASKTDNKLVRKSNKQSPDKKKLNDSSDINIKKNNQQNQASRDNVSSKIKRCGKSENNVSVNKLNSETISAYFSSSDDVPLKEIQRRCNSSNKYSTSNKSQSSTKVSLNISKSKICSTNDCSVPCSKSNSTSVSENKKFCPTDNSKKTSGRSKSISHDLVIDSKNRNKQKEEPSKKHPRILKNRKSAPSYHEVNTTSEDEVEIPRRTRKNENINRKLNSSNSKLTNNNLNPQKINEESSENNFETKKNIPKKKSIDRRVLSSDDDNTDYLKKIGNDFWAEVYLEAEEKWISVDLTKGKVHCIQQLYNRATQPVRYIIAFNNDGTAKDVTRRYAPQWLTVTRRLRVDDNWWRETIAPYTPRRTIREKDEDEDLDRQLHDKPLPTSITEYKNHPLYALRRHLLKFEAIYPPDAPPLGFVRGEPVYSRGCVVDLHTRETWIKEAKLVRRGEEPYKIVKARPKWDKVSQKVINDLPLPLFGHWQVEDYIPPPAVDGKVPRNEYGNVELYKPCMLPAGTVHLQVPQLARVARKLNIDCAPAVVGWEFSGGSSHPVLDGFIVCEEVKDVLLDAWNKEMDESAKRAKEKVEQRVYGNWKRLIKGLLIRERLKLRYDFGVPEPKKKKQLSKPGTSKT